MTTDTTTFAAQPNDMPILADAIGDSPETVIAHYLLTNRLCNAWYCGDVHQPRAIIVQSLDYPQEPSAFGWDTDAIARMLRDVRHWTTIQVPSHLAAALERPVAVAAGSLSVSTLEDIHHILDRPVADIAMPDEVRLLGPDDALLRHIVGEMASSTTDQTVIAAAVIDDEPVSIAHTFAWSPRYVDIGVTTHEAFQNSGFATAASALVVGAIQRTGRVPVWSTGATNAASLRVAEKLGFKEVSRRLYIIPDVKSTNPSNA